MKRGKPLKLATQNLVGAREQANDKCVHATKVEINGHTSKEATEHGLCTLAILGPFWDLLSRVIKMVYVNGIHIYVDVVGRGKPLVFVHGNGEDHTIFDTLVEKLKENFTCYVMDSRSHGKSEFSHDLHYDVMAQDVYGVIEHFKLDQPGFIGFSDGGIIGLHLAYTYPDLFSQVMVLGANIHTKGIVKPVREAWLKVYQKTQDPLFKLMIEEPNYRFKDLEKIKASVMVVVGEHDVISKRHTKAIVRHIHDAKLVVMKEKHHEDYIVHRDDVYPLCMNFFTKP